MGECNSQITSLNKLRFYFWNGEALRGRIGKAKRTQQKQKSLFTKLVEGLNSICVGSQVVPRNGIFFSTLFPPMEMSGRHNTAKAEASICVWNRLSIIWFLNYSTWKRKFRWKRNTKKIENYLWIFEEFSNLRRVGKAFKTKSMITFGFCARSIPVCCECFYAAESHREMRKKGARGDEKRKRKSSVCRSWRHRQCFDREEKKTFTSRMKGRKSISPNHYLGSSTRLTTDDDRTRHLETKKSSYQLSAEVRRR